MAIDFSQSEKGMYMQYACANCKKAFEAEDKIRCPFCGFRISFKPRPVFRKKVAAR